MTNIHITHARLVTPASSPTDIFIAQGQIVALGQQPAQFQAEQIIDASGCIVLPGLVDIAVSCREPGYEQKGTIARETDAASRGGITTLCTLPDTNPICDTPSVIEAIYEKNHAQRCRIRPIAALTQGLQGTQLTEMAALKKAGCCAVGNHIYPITNTRVLRRAFEYAATFSLPVFFTPIDAYLSVDGVMHEGFASASMGLPGIPATAETIALSAALLLQAQTGVHCHFCRISTQAGVALIRQAKASGQHVTADVAIHHLHLTDNDVLGYNAYCHVIPPLRTLADQRALIEGVASGVIDVICSDHQPHESTAKIAPFLDTEPGISGVETLLPLVYQLVEKKAITLETLERALCTAPATLIGDTHGGTIRVGNRADLCIFDPNAYWILTEDALYSQGLNTPFLGWPMSGRVLTTIMDGHITYQHDASGSR